MELRITAETPPALTEYEKVPIAFTVETVFRVELLDEGLSGVALIEDRVREPYVKDYDRLPGERPSNWPARFDLANWGFLAVFDGARRIAGAALAWRTPGLLMLEDRDDLACLWDLRVAPEYRGQRIGETLFAFASFWAMERGCRLLKVETQNVNVPACRFYVRQGCRLGGFNLHAYPAELNETQLVFYKDL